MKKRIWTCLISHLHGTDIVLGATRVAVNRKLYEYVKDNWDDEIGSGSHKETIPRARQEAIDRYFELVGNRIESESYEIESFDATDIFNAWNKNKKLVK